MKVLVVGSEGYVGRALCDHLLSLGTEIVGVDVLMYGQKPRPYCDGDALPEAVALEIRPDCVVWLGAYAHDPGGRIPRTAMMQNNSLRPVAFCQRLLDASGGCPPCRVVVVSSLAVHSAGHDAYPDSKRDLERRLAALDPHRWIRVLRFGTLFGYHEPESFRPHLLLNRMALDAVRRGCITVRGPRRRRPVLPLDLAVDALMDAITDRGPDGVVSNHYLRSMTLEGYAREVSRAVKTCGVSGHTKIITADDTDGDTRDYGFYEEIAHWSDHLYHLIGSVECRKDLGEHDTLSTLHDFVARNHPHATC